MQLIDGRPVYSATDLVGFLACEHLTNLERAALVGLTERPMHRAASLEEACLGGSDPKMLWFQAPGARHLVVLAGEEGFEPSIS